ncbi:60S acidic ribosomal protein P2-like [Durio zibethinus]|uniref:60S acidic ribosomal protein P2-like n=1 Tax=Durio zibethinus TaxID=66656 RepID=A0A6P6AR37_DURZI|nr:60S acidic ribosomal protein P2-like [Durio zibethinus]
MKVIAAYLLAVLGGNANPSADDLKHILGSVAAEADDDKIKLLLSQVKRKDLTELIAAGKERLAMAAVPSGGAAVPTTAAAAEGPATTAIADPAVASAAEAKKEEKIVEESDDDMCFSLFD